MRRRPKGFSLIEVLIAVLIFAIGLLGIASLQLFGLRQNLNSNMRTVAGVLVQDIAERVRANPLAATPLAATPYNGINTAAFNDNQNCTANACTSDQLALHDVREWKEAIEAELPGGIGTLAVNGDLLNVIIRWDEQQGDSDIRAEYSVLIRP